MRQVTEKEALESIIEWTDCEGLPDTKDERLEYYARRMMIIRNAARTPLTRAGTVSRMGVLLSLLADQVRIHDAAQSGALNVFGERTIAGPLSHSAIEAIREHLAAIAAGHDAIDMSDSLTPSKY